MHKAFLASAPSKERGVTHASFDSDRKLKRLIEFERQRIRKKEWVINGGGRDGLECFSGVRSIRKFCGFDESWKSLANTDYADRGISHYWKVDLVDGFWQLYLLIGSKCVFHGKITALDLSVSILTSSIFHFNS